MHNLTSLSISLPAVTYLTMNGLFLFRFLSRGDLNFCINRDTPPPGTDHDRPAIIYTVICTRPPEAKRRNSYETEGARVGGGKS